jgi:hypothetical protein
VSAACAEVRSESTGVELQPLRHVIRLLRDRVSVIDAGGPNGESQIRLAPTAARAARELAICCDRDSDDRCDTLEALLADVSRAGEVGRKLFPPTEAGLITELIRRDLPFYDASLSRRRQTNNNASKPMAKPPIVSQSPKLHPFGTAMNSQ